jgi:hypothetical protein
MMRAARERPRVAVAMALCTIAVIAVSVAIGAVIARSSSTVPEATQLRLTSVENAARDQAGALRTARAELSESNAAIARLKQRLRGLRSKNAELRSALRKGRRSVGSRTPAKRNSGKER